MNSVNIIGRTCSEIELRYTPSGKAVTELNLAVDDGYGDQKKTCFFKVVVWDKAAESAAKHLVKGQKIGVTGRLSQEKFIAKDGKEVTKTHIVCQSLEFLEKPKDREPGGQHQQAPPREQPRNQSVPSNRPGAQQPADEYSEEDDIPF